MKHALFFVVFLFMGVIMVKIASAQLPLETLKTFTLPCGLKVIFQKNDSAKVVAIQIWVKTGSAYEEREKAGISHFIEHMVFKGTKHYPSGEIAKIIERHGGSINAYTSFDYTVYHVVMPSPAWEVGLDVLADMVKNAIFDKKELEQERKVILEEIRKDHDSPYFVLSNTLFSTAYKVYPYRRPVIGWEKTVNALTRNELLQYYHNFYQPKNMVISIVGNVKEEDIKNALNKLFPKDHFVLPSVSFPKELSQRQMRLKILKRSFKETYMALAFPIPSCGTKEAHAFDVLSQILGGGESSRLTVALKLKKPVVHSISTYAFTPKGPGLFVIYVVLEEKNIREALKEIFQQIEEIKQNGVLGRELEKAKLNVEADFIYDQETMEGWARTLGMFEVVEGDARRCEKYLFDIKSVDVKRIKEVAKRFLVPNYLSLVIILPKEANLNLTKEDIYALWPRYVKKEKIVKKKIKKIIFKNGITLLIKENHHLPTFAVSAVFLGGLRVETKKTNGICNFVSKMLMRGTKTHSAIELANKIESMAGEVDTFCGWNTFGI
ncbi:MAG TPA: insulinase family protein, partial [Candidatus Desulfofervidus auxilii]|nr:insulinase family protein [Candidatus Desulfofervidus auxilii]